MKIKTMLYAARLWFFNTPQRALDLAYRAALTIKRIEDEHFLGQKISAEFSDYSDSVIYYFQTELRKYLRIIKLRLTEFKASNSFLNIQEVLTEQLDIELKTYSLANYPKKSILDKLNFIDEILYKYTSIPPKSQSKTSDIDLHSSQEVQEGFSPKSVTLPSKSSQRHTNTTSNKASLLPRSIFNTFNRIKQDINPKVRTTEEEILKQYRQSRHKTLISLKLLLTLIVVPFVIHQSSKNLLIKPVVVSYIAQHPQTFFFNRDLEEEAYKELHRFEERLQFKNLTTLAPIITPEEMEARVKEKAQEIVEFSRHRGADAISNIFADAFSFLTFVGIIAVSRKEIIVFKSFLDSLIYGLSDSAKAFLIILLTDIFVGYHSPHGWEILLESISRHLGLPENRDFNFIFIATFPVILDTVMKYWIFRYLNQISPSAVATYKNMND
jgi:CemA family